MERGSAMPTPRRPRKGPAVGKQEELPLLPPNHRRRPSSASNIPVPCSGTAKRDFRAEQTTNNPELEAEITSVRALSLSFFPCQIAAALSKTSTLGWQSEREDAPGNTVDQMLAPMGKRSFTSLGNVGKKCTETIMTVVYDNALRRVRRPHTKYRRHGLGAPRSRRTLVCV